MGKVAGPGDRGAKPSVEDLPKLEQGRGLGEETEVTRYTISGDWQAYACPTPFNVELDGVSPHSMADIKAAALRLYPEMTPGEWQVAHWGDRDGFDKFIIP